MVARVEAFAKRLSRTERHSHWRLDKNGQPRFLEINALPDIMDDAISIIKMYRHKSGNGQSDFLLEIINYALDAH